MRKSTFSAPASPTSGLQTYDLEGAQDSKYAARLKRLEARNPGVTAKAGERLQVLLAARQKSSMDELFHSDGMNGGIRQITSEVFNDLGPATIEQLPGTHRAIMEVPVADPETIADVCAALEVAAPHWRQTPELLTEQDVPAADIVALQAGVHKDKVASIQAKLEDDAFEGPTPIGILISGLVYIRDGHHRTIAEIANGADHVRMRIAAATLADVEKGYGLHGFWNGTEPDRHGGGGGRGGSRRSGASGGSKSSPAGGAAAAGEAKPKGVDIQRDKRQQIQEKGASRFLRDQDAKWQGQKAAVHTDQATRLKSNNYVEMFQKERAKAVDHPDNPFERPEWKALRRIEPLPVAPKGATPFEKGRINAARECLDHQTNKGHEHLIMLDEKGKPIWKSDPAKADVAGVDGPPANRVPVILKEVVHSHPMDSSLSADDLLMIGRYANALNRPVAVSAFSEGGGEYRASLRVPPADFAIMHQAATKHFVSEVAATGLNQQRAAMVIDHAVNTSLAQLGLMKYEAKPGVQIRETLASPEGAKVQKLIDAFVKYNSESAKAWVDERRAEAEQRGDTYLEKKAAGGAPARMNDYVFWTPEMFDHAIANAAKDFSDAEERDAYVARLNEYKEIYAPFHTATESKPSE